MLECVGGGGGGGSVYVRRPSVSLFVRVCCCCVRFVLLVLLVEARAGDPACVRYRSGEINYVHEYIYKCMFVFATSYAF